MLLPNWQKEMLLGEKIASQIDINNFLNPDGTLDINSLEDYIRKKYQNELKGVYKYKYIVVAVAVAAVLVVAIFWAADNPNVPLDNIGVAEMLPVNSSLRMDKLVNEIAVNYKK